MEEPHEVCLYIKPTVWATAQAVGCFFREGMGQAEMPAFPFADAREPGEIRKACFDWVIKSRRKGGKGNDTRTNSFNRIHGAG